MSMLLYPGWSMWAIGFLMETVADAQKSYFRHNPANKVKLRPVISSYCLKLKYSSSSYVILPLRVKTVISHYWSTGIR